VEKRRKIYKVIENDQSFSAACTLAHCEGLEGSENFNITDFPGNCNCVVLHDFLRNDDTDIDVYSDLLLSAENHLTGIDAIILTVNEEYQGNLSVALINLNYNRVHLYGTVSLYYKLL